MGHSSCQESSYDKSVHLALFSIRIYMHIYHYCQQYVKINVYTTSTCNAMGWNNMNDHFGRYMKHFYTHNKSRDWMLQLKLVLLFNQQYYVWNPVLSKNVCFIWILNLRGKFGAKSSLTAMNTNVGLIWRNVEVWRRWASGWLTNISKDDTFWNVYWMNVF